MKKILLFVLLVFPFYTFATAGNVTFNMSTGLRLDENQGQVKLPILKVNLGKNTMKDFNFTISEKDFFIFANDINGIEINDLKTNIDSIILDSKNKKIKINLKEKISGDIEIKGIKIRTYDQEIRDAKIGLDYNNDNEIDLYSNYTISLEENSRYSDTMAPLPVLNIQKEINKNKYGTYDINITWNISPDLDIYGSFIKVNKNNNYGNIKEQFISKTDEQSFIYTNMDLENDIYRIEIYSKDFYYSNKDPIIINLNTDDLIIEEEIIKEEIIKEEIIEEEIIEEEIIKEEIIKEEIIEEEKKNIVIEKYTPIFIKYNILYKITGIIDNYINKSLFDSFDLNKKNQVLIIRNEIIKILEQLDISEKKDILQIAEEFKSKFIDFKLILN